MEIPINPNAILGFLLFFAVAYLFAWMLLVKNWLVKIFGVIGGLKLLELALGTNSYIIVTAILLAYIVAFREVLLKWVQSLIEWFFIIKEHLEAIIRIILYPFIYAYKFIFTGFAHVREEVNQSSGSKNSWQDDELNRAREDAYRQSQESDEARRKAEREKERYKEEARKAREEARKQEENNNSESSSSSSKKNKVDNRTPEKILGLSSGFTIADLKKAYRSLSGRYHPDRYTHMSSELQEEMAEEFKNVQGAYNKLLKEV
jgi:hypothetical protein